MSNLTEKLVKLGTGVIGLALLATLILPGRNTAKMLDAMNKAYADAIKYAFAYTVINDHSDVELAWEYIYEMSSDAQLDLLTDLNDEDFEWLERMSRDV